MSANAGLTKLLMCSWSMVNRVSIRSQIFNQRKGKRRLTSELLKLLNTTKLTLFSNKSVVWVFSFVANETPSISGKYKESFEESYRADKVSYRKERPEFREKNVRLLESEFSVKRMIYRLGASARCNRGSNPLKPVWPCCTRAKIRIRMSFARPSSAKRNIVNLQMPTFLYPLLSVQQIGSPFLSTLFPFPRRFFDSQRSR